jgi:hypothetical protein
VNITSKVSLQISFFRLRGDIMEWISVNKKMPPLNERVIALESDESDFYGDIYKLFTHDNNGEITWYDDEGYSYGCVTHWMPLPKPPK